MFEKVMRTTFIILSILLSFIVIPISIVISIYEWLKEGVPHIIKAPGYWFSDIKDIWR